MNCYEKLKESLEQTVAIDNERQLVEEVEIAEQQFTEGKGVSSQEAREKMIRNINTKHQRT
jgi:hypothetical protein